MEGRERQLMPSIHRGIINLRVIKSGGKVCMSVR